MKVEYLMTAGVIAALATMVCWYAAKYELVKLGVTEEPNPIRIWKIARTEHKTSLWFWAIALWVYWISAMALFPFVVYFTYLGLK